MDKQAIADGCKAVADALVISTDDGARTANLYHWYRAKPLADRVVARLTDCGDQSIIGSAARLRSAPRDPAPYWLFCAALEKAVEANLNGITEILKEGIQAFHKMRIGYHIGSNYQPGQTDLPSSESIYAVIEQGRGHAEPDTAGRDCRRQSGDGAVILVVIPFRDRGKDRTRTLNLLACLQALRDQEPATVSSHVVVVETDSHPRHSAEIASYSDQYVFAPKDGDFNKSWAVNVGVSNADCKPDLICILDADVLVDAEFIYRNFMRFSRPGIGSFLPFFDICYLDELSSIRAIWSRCAQRERHIDLKALRGFVVRRPPGGCVWMRSDVFASIRGMDERYEGWGGEDLDLALRLFRGSALHFFDDPTVHLHHASSAVLIDTERKNSYLQLMSWSPDQPIGKIDKFSSTSA